VTARRVYPIVSVSPSTTSSQPAADASARFAQCAGALRNDDPSPGHGSSGCCGKWGPSCSLQSVQTASHSSHMPTTHRADAAMRMPTFPVPQTLHVPMRSMHVMESPGRQ
jgi:hypothetical protein